MPPSSPTSWKQTKMKRRDLAEGEILVETPVATKAEIQVAREGR